MIRCLCVSVQISIVMNKITGKPRGYAFIIYERERDMHCKIYMYIMLTVFISENLTRGGKVNCNKGNLGRGRAT